MEKRTAGIVMGVSAASVCFGVLGGIAGYEYSLLTQQYQDQYAAEQCLKEGSLYPIDSLSANCRRVVSALPKADGQLQEIPRLGDAYASVGREQDEWEAEQRMAVEWGIAGFALTVLTSAIVIAYSREHRKFSITPISSAANTEESIMGSRGVRSHSEVAIR